MEVDDDLELVGTTAMAFHCKNSIKVIVDSRISNEATPENERKGGWQLKVRNDAEKWFKISDKILAIMIGQRNPCLTARTVVKDWVRGMPANGENILVKEVANFLENYFQKLRMQEEVYKFGLIISGHDSTKGLQVYQLYIIDDDVNKVEVDMYTIFGTGSVSANQIMAPEHHLNLSDGDAKNLAWRAIFNSSFYNKSTYGNLHYFDVTKYGWSLTQKVEALQTYACLYLQYEESRILFLVYMGDEFLSTDEFVALFRPYDIIVGHVVDCRITSANRIFSFHRVMFVSNEKAKKALEKGSQLDDKYRGSTILSKFGSQINYKGKTLFMQKASSELLLHVLCNSKMVVDQKTKHKS